MPSSPHFTLGIWEGRLAKMLRAKQKVLGVDCDGENVLVKDCERIASGCGVIIIGVLELRKILSQL